MNNKPRPQQPVKLTILPEVALVVPHMLTGDQIETVPIVRYLRLFYPEVHLWSIKKNIEQVRLFYADDPNIKVYEVGNNWTHQDPAYYKDNKIDQYLPSNIYAYGFHTTVIYKHTSQSYANIPLCFYKHMNLTPNIYWNYFYINESPMAHKLYESLVNTKNYVYVFTHTETGAGPLFSVTDIEKHAKITHKNVLLIDPNKNNYTRKDKFYQIAQRMVGLKINDYTQVMIHAQSLYLSDSSFFCLAMQLGILTDKCYLRSRSSKNYDYLWETDYGFANQIGHGSDANKKQFRIF